MRHKTLTILSYIRSKLGKPPMYKNLPRSIIQYCFQSSSTPLIHILDKFKQNRNIPTQYTQQTANSPSFRWDHLFDDFKICNYGLFLVFIIFYVLFSFQFLVIKKVNNINLKMHNSEDYAWKLVLLYFPTKY